MCVTSLTLDLGVVLASGGYNLSQERSKARAALQSFLLLIEFKTSSPDKIACAPSPPAPRQCTPPQLAHSLRRTRMRPHSAIRIHTEHVPCELLAATHTHNTIHCT